jgi:hypothetical protein
MKTTFINREFPYDGTQLRSLYAYLEHKIQGDSIISWIGPCSISFDHMVDGEDLLEGATIAGNRMVHFIIELFHEPLFAAVAVQRVLAAIVLDFLREQLDQAVHGEGPRDISILERSSSRLRREGDDIYFHDGKLSISIATVSPVSALIHFAVNCTNDGTPVKTASLEDLGLEGKDFATEIMSRFKNEIKTIQEATVKVRWVK